jgi:hypothetical protein
MQCAKQKRIRLDAVMPFPLHRICRVNLPQRSLLKSILSQFIYCLAVALVVALPSGCVSDNRHRMIVSVADQKMILLRDGKPVSCYPVSTSKFGVGDAPGSCATPLGVLRVKEKIGHSLPSGTVLKSRQPTGEILQVNAPGRDPIVTRIIWLDGLDPQNRNAFRRFILHSWHTRGAEYRSARQLRLYSHEIGGCDRAFRHHRVEFKNPNHSQSHSDITFYKYSAEIFEKIVRFALNSRFSFMPQANSHSEAFFRSNLFAR